MRTAMQRVLVKESLLLLAEPSQRRRFPMRIGAAQQPMKSTHQKRVARSRRDGQDCTTTSRITSDSQMIRQRLSFQRSREHKRDIGSEFLLHFAIVPFFFRPNSEQAFFFFFFFFFFYAAIVTRIGSAEKVEGSCREIFCKKKCLDVPSA
jgi:hypothetical protein